MKIFNTFQELWNYCLYCPVCLEDSRTIHMDLEPAILTSHTLSEKTEDHYIINFHLLMKTMAHHVQFDINCLNNSVETTFISETKSNRDLGSSSPYIYMNLFSECSKCEGCSNVDSSAVEIDFLSKKILNIGLNKESIYFLKPKDKYHVTFEYKSNMMYITRCVVEKDGSILDENSIFKFPIINLDLTNQEKCVNKIKTILIFS